MSQIQTNDEHPFFQAFTVIQEGISKPSVIGETAARPIFWIRDVVEKAASVIKTGLQFFLGHNTDNSTQGRKPLGRVVGKISKVIDGKLTQIAIGYFPDKSKVKDLDAVSIEADVLVGESTEMDVAKNVENVSGIAMANSRFEKPAFAGAVRLATLQCFEGDSKPENQTGEPGKGQKQMTYEEFKAANFDWFKQAIRDRKMFPSHLGFNEDDLRKDVAFSDHFRTFDENTTKLTETEKLLNDEKDARQKDALETSKATAKTRLENFLPEGFTQLHKDFVLKTFDPEKVADLTDDGLKQYVEGSKNEYKKYAEVFGQNIDEQGTPGNDTKDTNTGDANRFNTDTKDTVETTLLNEIIEDGEKAAS